MTKLHLKYQVIRQQLIIVVNRSRNSQLKNRILQTKKDQENTFHRKRINISKTKREIVGMMDSSTKQLELRNEDCQAGSMMQKQPGSRESLVIVPISSFLGTSTRATMEFHLEVVAGLVAHCSIVLLSSSDDCVESEWQWKQWRTLGVIVPRADFPCLFLFKSRLLERHGASNDFVERLWPPSTV